MKTTLSLITLFVFFILSTSFIALSDSDTYDISLVSELSGPCECDKGWNFTVHQVTPEGCREKSIYCVEGVTLEPGYSCGTCPKQCSTCEEDEQGNITICRVFNNGNTSTYRAQCKDLQDFFVEDGNFKKSKDHCGSCTCADAKDEDSDGDGICDKKDGCPNNEDKSEPGLCGCDDQDSDGDGVCDSEDQNPDIDDGSDSDQDGIPDELDLCDITGNNWYEWIETVKINDFTNKSGDDSRGYGNYSDKAISMTNDTELSIWVTAGYTDKICDMSHAIFIDWNRDHDFEDSGEMIFNQRGIGEMGIQIPLPSDIKFGKYAVRILIDLGRIYGACGGCIDGEAEDYIIEILQESCPEIYEGFDYSYDQKLEGLNGGRGWKESWQVESDGDAQAIILQSSLYQFPYGESGHKLGILNAPGSRLNIARSINDPIIQKGNDVWMSFLYSYDANSVFSPSINNTAIGFSVDSDGYVIIGGLKGTKLNRNQTYLFLIQAILTQGTDEIHLWIDPSADDSGSRYYQKYNVPIDGNAESIGFEFWAADNGTDKTGQYLDEIRFACSKDEVLLVQGASAKALTRSSIKDVNLNIYPNPIRSGEGFTIDMKRSGSLINEMNIYDAQGRLMMERILYAGSNHMNLPYLESGIYIIEVSSIFSTVRAQIVVQNN